MDNDNDKMPGHGWLDRCFTHPTKVCMGYFHHMRFSLYICTKLLKGSVQALVHAFYPDCFVTSSSDLVEELAREMSAIGCK